MQKKYLKITNHNLKTKDDRKMVVYIKLKQKSETEHYSKRNTLYAYL